MKSFRALLAAVLAFFSMTVFAAVDINKATAAELDSVKGIGPAIAQRIVTERAKGPFKDWADVIARVNGFGEKSSAHFSENGLTVNGASYKGAAPAAAAASPAAKPAMAAPVAPAAPAVVPAPAATKAAAPAAKAAEPAMAKAEAKADPKAEAKAKKEAEKQAKKDAADKATDKKASAAAQAASAPKK